MMVVVAEVSLVEAVLLPTALFIICLGVLVLAATAAIPVLMEFLDWRECREKRRQQACDDPKRVA